MEEGLALLPLQPARHLLLHVGGMMEGKGDVLLHHRPQVGGRVDRQQGRIHPAPVQSCCHG